jgi:hypothetical protein
MSHDLKTDIIMTRNLVADFHRTWSELCASEEISVSRNTNVATVIINKMENVVYLTLRIPLHLWQQLCNL